MLHELCFEVKSGERVGIGKHYYCALVTFTDITFYQSVARVVERLAGYSIGGSL